MGRKRIKKGLEPDLEDDFDEEKAKEVYSKKEFVPPRLSDLETIFEREDCLTETQPEVDCGDKRGGRRKCFVDASTKMTKAPRRIDTKYWIEDKEKDRKRKTMIAKLFKGRKKIKFTGLNEKQEKKFNEIFFALDTEDTKEESPPPKPKVQNRIKSKASTKQPETKVQEHMTESPEPVEPEELAEEDLPWAPLPKTPASASAGNLTSSSSEDSKSKRERRKSVRRRSSLFIPGNGTNHHQPEPDLEVTQDKLYPVIQSDENTNPGKSSAQTSNIHEPTAAEVTSETTDFDPETELAKQIEEADSIFGPIGFENSSGSKLEIALGGDKASMENEPILARKLSPPMVVKRKAFGRRSNMATQKLKVRRSSRIFQQQDHSSQDEIGSIYQEMLVTIKRKSKSNSTSPRPKPKSGDHILASIENKH